MKHHYSNIIYTLQYLDEIFHQRLDIFFGKNDEAAFNIPELQLVNDSTEFYKLLSRDDISIKEKIIFLIAFCAACSTCFFR